VVPLGPPVPVRALPAEQRFAHGRRGDARVAITPRAAGHVHVTGVRVRVRVRVRYEQGMRRGDQLVGFEIDTKTK